MRFKPALIEADGLLVDKIYEGGRLGNSADDPVHPLIGVSNQGGFRIIGKKEAPKLIVLTSNLRDPTGRMINGIFTYFGDNKKPGHELHDTPRYGNQLLRDIFDNSHGSKVDRANVPHVLVFTNTGFYRDVQFLGLAAPSAQDLDSNNDLVAIWKLKNGKRFQNYQAKFTILDLQMISKSWIADVKSGNTLSLNCPAIWRLWVETGTFKAPKVPRVLHYRTKGEQLPSDDGGIKIIHVIQKYFTVEPLRFEACAAEIAKMILKNIVAIDLTRPVKDGGRDAIGRFRIGDGDVSVWLSSH